MEMPLIVYIDETPGYRCRECYTFVAHAAEFRNNILWNLNGRIYIFTGLVNVIIGEGEEVDNVPRISLFERFAHIFERFTNVHGVRVQRFITAHRVRGWKYSIYCRVCRTWLGLKFIDVELELDLYCLQRNRLVRSDGIDSPGA